MDEKESMTTVPGPGPGLADPYQDIKSLWDRWDQVQQEEHPSQLVKGLNLVGVGLIIVGAMFQNVGSGLWRDGAAPLMVAAGAVILAVKKIKALWLQRLVDH
jgi:hypothetical protein